MRIAAVISTLMVLCLSGVTLAESPPFSKVTVKGKTKDIYNKVCLFEKGGAKQPLKTQYISKSNGTYSIDINIPGDMKGKDDSFFTDMRFWGDNNDNGVRDPGEPISQCHFIIWVPTADLVYMQVYKGPKYKFESSTLNYDYQ